MPDSSSPNLTDSSRILAFDIHRWFAFLAIVIYHSTFALWAPYGLTSTPPQNISGQALESFARLFATSGFFVLFLSFFLYGFRGSKKSSRLPTWLLFFALSWIALVQPWPYVWDIYPFLLVAMAATALLSRLPRPEYLAIGAATVLFIPFWRLESVLPFPLWLKTPLIGVCETRSDLGDWPLLPWLAYPVLATSLGRVAARCKGQLQNISRFESVLWCIALLGVSPWLNKYYVTKIGEDFGCFVFRRPPYEFWAQQVAFLFLLRLSLLGGIQRRLSRYSFAAWFSRRPVNQKFFIVYFLHYPLVHLGAQVLRYFQLDFHPWSLTTLVMSTLLSLELGAVVFGAQLTHNRWKELPWPRISAK